MNERAKLAQIIVQAIEEFPKVHKFLTSGDTGCHPQHLVDTIAKRIVESRGETLRENILTGFVAELKAMLTEAQEENEELVTVCEALVNHIVGMYASGGESLEVVIKARTAIDKSRL